MAITILLRVLEFFFSLFYGHFLLLKSKCWIVIRFSPQKADKTENRTALLWSKWILWKMWVHFHRKKQISFEYDNQGVKSDFPLCLAIIFWGEYSDAIKKNLLLKMRWNDVKRIDIIFKFNDTYLNDWRWCARSRWDSLNLNLNMKENKLWLKLAYPK